jgi:hypothetical protein
MSDEYDLEDDYLFYEDYLDYIDNLLSKDYFAIPMSYNDFLEMQEGLAENKWESLEEG